MRTGLLFAVLAVSLLAGCVGVDLAEPQGGGFVATYTKDGEPYVKLTLDGPVQRYGADLVLRPAYRLRYESLDGTGPDWEHREAAYYDGDWRLVRDDGCSIQAKNLCERFSVRWAGADDPDISLTGAFWPITDSPSLQRSQREDTLVIQHKGYETYCYEYEGERPVPVRSCDGSMQLADYERLDLPRVQAWPATAARPAAGPSTNELFPGAEQDLQGLGFNSLEALAALRANSMEAAADLQAGGCVLTTLFGHGSGGFSSGFPDGLLENLRPLGNISFTLQDVTGHRTKYTLTWGEDATGMRRFSTRVQENSPDFQGGPPCEAARAAPWPTVSASEFLQTMEGRFGRAAPDGFTVSRQPAPLAPGTHLRYEYDGPTSWGGASMVFDAEAGHFGHASYISDRDLEPPTA